MTKDDVLSITSMVEAMAIKATEDTEKFVFETIKPYCDDVTKMEISKKDLEQALSQYFSKEPCEDAISRQAILDKLDEWDWQDLYLPVHFKENIIDELPPVQPSRKGYMIDDYENMKIEISDRLCFLDCKGDVLDIIAKHIRQI